MIPGTPAKHCIITEACREGRGDHGAIDEALARIRAEYLECVNGWLVGSGPRFHLVLTLEKPKGPREDCGP